MEWISDRDPKSPGLYASLYDDQKWNPNNLNFAYFDEEGWKIPAQCDLKTAPIRGRPYAWAAVKWGTD